MHEANESPPKPNQREAVLEELAKFIRHRNEPEKKRWSFLDRPIVVALVTMLISGGIIGGATSWWQIAETRRIKEVEYQRALIDTKFALLRTFAGTYQRSSSILNSWLCHVLWRAGEMNEAQKNVGKINSLGSTIVRLQEEYSKAESVDGVLGQIESIFSGDARTTAQSMKRQWAALENEMRDVNEKYNVAESISNADIKRFEEARKATVLALDALESRLLTQMGKEIRDTLK